MAGLALSFGIGKLSRRQGSSTAEVLSGETITINEATLRRVVATCLVKAGADVAHAPLVADVLVAADRRGIPSHGVNRCEIYCAELEAGLIDGKAVPKMMAGCDGPGTGLVDGQNALGAVVSRFAMLKCIEKAKANGIGLVAVCHSNHFGIAAYWALMAQREGLIGMSFTNTSPFMVPTRSSKRAAGTNPICFCCPAGKDSFELDMATTTVPVGKVEVLHRKRQAVPPGWGVDRTGRGTSDAEEILMHGGIAPVGGEEQSAGYKGYGLAMMVEVLCAVLSGTSTVGPSVLPFTATRGAPVDYGHCFICIDPARFAPGFELRLARYMSTMRSLPATSPGSPVLVPGDPEKASWEKSETDGVRLHVNIAGSLRRLAERLGVEVPAELRNIKSGVAVDAPFASKH